MKRADIIRVGDTVKILTPRIVTRVGYPKSVKDYSEEIREQHRLPVKDLMILAGGRNVPDGLYKRIETRICHELGYLRAKTQGFGGSERSLHFQEVPDLVGV